MKTVTECEKTVKKSSMCWFLEPSRITLFISYLPQHLLDITHEIISLYHTLGICTPRAWKDLPINNVLQNQLLWLQLLSFNYSSQWKKINGIITDVSLNFVSRQNESKIRRITFYDLVIHRSFKLFEIHTQEIKDSEFYRKTPQQWSDYAQTWEIRTVWYRFLALEKIDKYVGQTSNHSDC